MAFAREIDAMLEFHTDSEIVNSLNERGQKSGDGAPFTSMIIKHLRHAYGLKSRERRLREAGDAHHDRDRFRSRSLQVHDQDLACTRTPVQRQGRMAL
jgi:hypothetical protein